MLSFVPVEPFATTARERGEGRVAERDPRQTNTITWNTVVRTEVVLSTKLPPELPLKNGLRRAGRQYASPGALRPRAVGATASSTSSSRNDEGQDALDEAYDFAGILCAGQRLMSCPAKDGRHIAGTLRVWHRATVMMMVMVRGRCRGRVLGRPVDGLRTAAGADVVVVVVVVVVATAATSTTTTVKTTDTVVAAVVVGQVR